MKYRPLGSTGITVSEIGFGAWGIGGPTKGATSYGVTDDKESIRSLEAAFDAGVTFYDTANIYGYGHSESLIGKTFKNRRDKVVIASKVGFLDHNAPQDFSRAYIRKCLEETLGFLETDYLDLYQLHSPTLDAIQSEETMSTLKELKREGKIKAIGLSVRKPDDALTAIEAGYQTVQVNFNLTDQRARQNGLFAACEKKKAGLIIRTPLSFGFLTGAFNESTNFESNDHRATHPPEQKKAWADASRLFVSAVSEKDGITSAQVAIGYCLSYPAVSSVIPGMLKVSEVKENVVSSDKSPLSPRDVQKMEEIFEKNNFFFGRKW